MSTHYLDVALGLAATFLSLSLLCSASREALASLFQSRAKMLLDGILTLLYEPAGLPLLRGILPSLRRLLRRDGGFDLRALGPTSLAAAVLAHPLITGLAQPGRMPSYIPSSIFARALLATLMQRHGPQSSARALLERIGNPPLQRSLLALLGSADDLDALEQALRCWYDTVMARTSGWYKRRSQLLLFMLALGYAVAMNIDAITLSQRLWRDQSLAAQLAQQSGELMAQQHAASASLAGVMQSIQPPLDAAAQDQNVAAASVTLALTDEASPAAGNAGAALGSATQLLGTLPIGWPSARLAGLSEAPIGAALLALLLVLLGWTLTGFAASLGAPFWFDGLGWLLGLRETGGRPSTHAMLVAEPASLPSLRPAGAAPPNTAGSAASVGQQSQGEGERRR